MRYESPLYAIFLNLRHLGHSATFIKVDWDRCSLSETTETHGIVRQGKEILDVVVVIVGGSVDIMTLAGVNKVSSLTLNIQIESPTVP